MSGGLLKQLVAGELASASDSRAVTLASLIAARHPGASAVLFYGSCLRQDRLDGRMLDFYLIVRDYDAAYGRNRWLAVANRLLPPNVFPLEAHGLVAKYAVLSEADFARLASRKTRSVSVWARFAQPAQLLWASDGAAAARMIEAVAQAAPALFAAARPCLSDHADALDAWRRAFALTYGAELRAERGTRAASIVDADPDRYRRLTIPALRAADIGATLGEDGMLRFDKPLTAAARRAGDRDWARRRLEGKLLTLLRLIKASATFAGGIDYLAWKLGRHAGEPIALRSWQRRWPVLASLAMLPRLLARGAVR